MVTVLTPTYNRANTLCKLYSSLLQQTSFDFEWLIIDDGSTDDTEYLVKEFKSNKFPINYFKKKNGGKHTALNYSHQYINGETVIIVDSDDHLTTDAIKTINKDWYKFKKDLSIAVLSYQKKNEVGEILSEKSEEPYKIDDDINYRVNNNIKGDRCEVVRSSVFISYKFPEFENEKFIGEGWLWTNIARKFKTVYINEAIYNCEYLHGGLTKSGRLFRMNNSLGMMENCKVYFESPVRKKVRLKEFVLYGMYMLCSKKKMTNSLRDSSHPWAIVAVFPFSCALYLFWKNKYGFTKSNKDE